MHCSGEDALQFTMCTAVIKMHFLNGFYHAVHRLALRASQCRLLALPSTAVQDGCIIVSMFFWDGESVADAMDARSGRLMAAFFRERERTELGSTNVGLSVICFDSHRQAFADFHRMCVTMCTHTQNLLGLRAKHVEASFVLLFRETPPLPPSASFEALSDFVRTWLHRGKSRSIGASQGMQRVLTYAYTPDNKPDNRSLEDNVSLDKSGSLCRGQRWSRNLRQIRVFVGRGQRWSLCREDHRRWSLCSGQRKRPARDLC
jgi:hypothetical protein